MNDEYTINSISIELYEQLRDFVISPCKPISRPQGLDIWNKMGFKGWLMVMFRNQQCDEELLLINNKHKQNFTNSSSSQPELTTIFTNMILNRRVNI